MKYVILFFFIITLNSCQSVYVTADKDFHINSYKTFAYVKDGLSESKLSKEYKKIIVYETDRFLKTAGLKNSIKNPDLLIVIKPYFHKRIDVYVRPYGTSKIPSKEGHVTVQFIEAKTNKKVWEGKIPLRFKNKAELKRYIRKKYDKILEKYLKSN